MGYNRFINWKGWPMLSYYITIESELWIQPIIITFYDLFIEERKPQLNLVRTLEILVMCSAVNDDWKVGYYTPTDASLGNMRCVRVSVWVVIAMILTYPNIWKYSKSRYLQLSTVVPTVQDRWCGVSVCAIYYMRGDCKRAIVQRPWKWLANGMWRCLCDF